jgi:hypothetical protein
MDKPVSDTTQTATFYRGAVLQHMANLELFLNTYIAFFFCGRGSNRFQDMLTLILGDERMSLSSKAQIFHQISTHHDVKWYNAYESIRIPPKEKKGKYTLNNDLIFVIEERNIFAHRVCDIVGTMGGVDPVEDGALRFMRFKNSIEPIDYTKEKFSELLKVILLITTHFVEGTKGIKSTYAPSAPTDI